MRKSWLRLFFPFLQLAFVMGFYIFGSWEVVMEGGGIPAEGSIWGVSSAPRSTYPIFPRSFRFLGLRGVRSRSATESVATASPKWSCQIPKWGDKLFMGAVVAKVKWVGLGRRRDAEPQTICHFEILILKHAKSRT